MLAKCIQQSTKALPPLSWSSTPFFDLFEFQIRTTRRPVEQSPADVRKFPLNRRIGGTPPPAGTRAQHCRNHRRTRRQSISVPLSRNYVLNKLK